MGPCVEVVESGEAAVDSVVRVCFREFIKLYGMLRCWRIERLQLIVL